ncbi:MAG: hypothetical protein ACKOQ6_03740 [Bacteroidota bacterium]
MSSPLADLRKYALAGLLSICFSYEASASDPFLKDRSWIDTLNYSLHQRPKYFFNITSFKSFLADRFVNFFGFRMGVNYNKRMKFGLGFYSLDPQAVVSQIKVQEDGSEVVTNGKLNARFFSVTAEYIFYSKYPWQFSVIPVELGVGGAHYKYNSNLGDGRQLETADVGIVFYQPAVTAQYSILKWLGVAVGGGYRTTLYSSKEVKEDFDSFTINAGIKLFLDEAYREVFPDGIKFLKRKAVDENGSSKED